jgi:endothelin-converting enzyme
MIDWDLLISLLRQNEHPIDSLVITSPSYIQLMSTLIAKTDIMTIQYHFMNTLIHSVIGALSSDLSAPFNNMTLHISGGKASPSRQELCIQNTNMVLGQIVGRFYVLANFSQAAKDSVNELVNRLRRSLEQSIMQLEFFDDITRTVALDKVRYLEICEVIHQISNMLFGSLCASFTK